jgi:hypothetical protein
MKVRARARSASSNWLQRIAWLPDALSKPLPEGMLRLDPHLKTPRYYNEYDIHQDPGGFGGDPLAGFEHSNAAASGVVGTPQLHAWLARLDFLPPGDPLLRILLAGHRRNNEPFLLDQSRIDLEDAYARAGFRHVETIDFAEEDGALDAFVPKWRLPWAMIAAEK